MNTKFEEKREYKYLRFNNNNDLIGSGITKGLTINQRGEFYHNFVFNENTYDIQGQRLGNMIIFPLNDLTRLVVYLNDVPEEYREYKFEVGKKYRNGTSEYICVCLFNWDKNKIAVFKHDDCDCFYTGIIKKIENCEICEIEYGEFRADKKV